MSESTAQRSSESETLEEALKSFADTSARLRRELIACAANDRMRVLDQYREATASLERAARSLAPRLSQPAADSACRPAVPVESEKERSIASSSAWDEMQIREHLAGWAAQRRMVAKGTFDGPLKVVQRPLARARVTRLIESRSIADQTVPGGAPPAIGNSFGNSIDVVDVGAPADFQERRWDFLQAGSVVTRQCTQCVAGRITCRMCAGRGILPCPPTVRCSACFGRGIAGNQRCSTCGGSGQAPCSHCHGSGNKRCLACIGQGSHQCKACKGHGQTTSFRRGTILHKPSTQEMRWPDPVPEMGKLKEERWPAMHVVAEHSLPAGLPQPLQTLETALNRREPGELLRRVEVAVLPVTHVDYERAGRNQTAFLIGDDREIRAKGVRSLGALSGDRSGKTLGRTLWAVAAVVVALVVVALVVVFVVL